MKDTGFFDPETVIKNVALSYQKEFAEKEVRFKSNALRLDMGSADGGGYSTVEDLYKFFNALNKFAIFVG